MEVTVLKIQPVNKGSLKAFASVDIAGKLKIHSCRIVQQAGQAPWVSLPQNEWTDKDGNKKFFPVIEVPDAVKSAIETEILKVWRSNNGGGGGKPDDGGIPF
jgi:DNA-binding cell septation regulator SpoVG